jgi:c-di-GMP-binding flagellar brake protein YcgR
MMTGCNLARRHARTGMAESFDKNSTMTLASEYDQDDDMEPFRVRSRREIISLLRHISERNQLVRMVINHGADTVVTSILDVDESDNSVMLDCAPTATMNHRVLESETFSFETVLDSIRILFTSSEVGSILYDNLPAFVIPLPESMVRLQRREYYRVPTPLTTPVRCTVPVRIADEIKRVTTTLHNISGGGISIVDENQSIDATFGRVYDNCTIDLPGGPIAVSLQIRNLLELTLTNGKNIRRLGCRFVNPSHGVLAAVQKYITKLERDQNARVTGNR